MSDVVFSAPALFNAPPPDNDAQRATLARELRVAKGFTLIFALCNSAAERARQMNALKEDVPELRIQDVPVRKQIPHLLDVLRATLDDPAPDAVFVHGLENWIPSDANPHAVPFFLNLNAARNHFLVDCPCPLVLWMPDYLLRLIIGGAPDFASVRSGLYVFTTSAAEAQSAMQTLQSLNLILEYGLPLDEKQQRLRELTFTLSTLRSLPNGKRDPRDEAYLLYQLGQLHYVMGHYDQTEPLLQEALTILEDMQGREHSEIASILSNLALVYVQQGKFDRAETLHQEAVAIHKKVQGAEHPETAAALNNLAQLYNEQEKYDCAEPLLREALAIDEKMLGRQHPETATVLNNLAQTYSGQGRNDEAAILLQQALAISGNALGWEHPDTAATMNNLALLYAEQGQYDRAMSLFQEVLIIAEKTLGHDHPNTQAVRGSIALLKNATSL